MIFRYGKAETDYLKKRDPRLGALIDRIGPAYYRITLNEGKKREIRRITAAVGAPTLQLKRVRVGGLELGSLPPGRWRMLTPEEVTLSLKPN